MSKFQFFFCIAIICYLSIVKAQDEGFTLPPEDSPPLPPTPSSASPITPNINRNQNPKVGEIDKSVIYRGIYATATGGLFHSYNGGKNWTKFSGVNSQRIAFNKNRIYFATGRPLFTFFVTEDGFKTTNRVEQGLSSDDLLPKKIRIARGTVYIAKGAAEPLWDSYHTKAFYLDGTTWKAINPPQGVNTSAKLVIEFAGNNIYFSTPTQFYVSKDNGASWTSVSNVGGFRSITAASETKLFGTRANDSLLVFSSDSGNTWKNIFDIKKGDRNTLHDTALIADDVIYFSSFDVGVLMSNDNGTTWVRKVSTSSFSSVSTLPTNNVFGVAVDGKKLYVATRDGLYVREWCEEGVWKKVLDNSVSQTVNDVVVIT